MPHESCRRLLIQFDPTDDPIVWLYIPQHGNHDIQIPVAVDIDRRGMRRCSNIRDQRLITGTATTGKSTQHDPVISRVTIQDVVFAVAVEIQNLHVRYQRQFHSGLQRTLAFKQQLRSRV